jgi:4-hydroxybenzoate polyprenyltransferase
MISLPVINEYLKLFRISHWIKNILIFIPLLFSSAFLNLYFVIVSIMGFFIFSLLASIVYIINDIRDREKDRRHSTKCRRPIASGQISLHNAVAAIIILALFMSALIISMVLWFPMASLFQSVFGWWGLLFLYLILNIGYSFGFKNIPIIDITLLAAGYVIRVLFGASLIGSGISVWLYLTITVGAFYLGLGKRRNEIIRSETGTRQVAQFYSHNFLDKNMYMCQALCVVFYALWSIDTITVERFHTGAFVYTIPLVLIILLKYSLNVEADSDGDPTSVVLHDKVLMLLCIVYIVCAFCIIYFNRDVL